MAGEIFGLMVVCGAIIARRLTRSPMPLDADTHKVLKLRESPAPVPAIAGGRHPRTRYARI